MREGCRSGLVRREILNPLEWDALIASRDDTHFLQSWAWGEVKKATHWSPLRLAWFCGEHLAGAACLLFRPIRFGPISAAISYIPRGPLLNWNDPDVCDAILDDILLTARQSRAVFLKMDAEIITARGVPGEDESADPSGKMILERLLRKGWKRSPEQIQFRNTMWIDLGGGEETWLARMKQKTRYNLRLAERKGVLVRQAQPSEWHLLYRMYAETGLRDGFIIRPEAYYQRVWDLFDRQGMLTALIAEVDHQPVAGLIMIRYGRRAWYLYGMSRAVHRDKMPNYLLQWQAMRIAAQHGCQLYDLWGAPDTFSEADRMQGVFRFKEGLGGQVIQTLGALDYVMRPMVYWMYSRVLPFLLDQMRKIRFSQIQQEISE